MRAEHGAPGRAREGTLARMWTAVHTIARCEGARAGEVVRYRGER